MWMGEQEVDLHVVVDGKTIKQVKSFVYLGGTVCEDGGSSKEIQRRVYNEKCLTRLPPQTTSSRWQVEKEAIGLSRVQQFSHLCVARPYQISVSSIFKHIYTTSINTII